MTLVVAVCIVFPVATESDSSFAYEEFSETTCKDINKLVDILISYKGVAMDYSKFWNIYMAACDGHSADRICAFILEIMKRGNI